MLYLALVFSIAALAALSSWEWRKTQRVSRRSVQRMHKEIRQHLALEEWELAEKLLRRCPAARETQLLHIQLLRQTQRWDEAQKILRSALEQHPQALALHRERGFLCLVRGKALEALEAFERCLPLLREPEDRMMLATAYYRLGDQAQAWQMLEPELSDAAPGQMWALAGDCQFAQKAYASAVEAYDRAIEKGEDAMRLQLRRAHSLRQSGNSGEAEVAYRQILERDPEHIPTILSFGGYLEGRSRYTEALEVYQACGAWELGDGRILRQAGLCAAQVQEFEHAEAYLRQAMERGCATPKALAFLGYSLECQQKWGEAEAIYWHLNSLYPDHVAGCRGLAWLFGVGLSGSLDAKQALAFARRSVELLADPTSWEILSACEARAGNFDQAHQIQERLSCQGDRQRHLKAMRALRQGMPLDEALVARALVA